MISGSWARSSMVEQLTLNQRVGGSSPPALTTYSLGLGSLRIFLPVCPLWGLLGGVPALPQKKLRIKRPLGRTQAFRLGLIYQRAYREFAILEPTSPVCALIRHLPHRPSEHRCPPTHKAVAATVLALVPAQSEGTAALGYASRYGPNPATRCTHVVILCGVRVVPCCKSHRFSMARSAINVLLKITSRFSYILLRPPGGI